MGAALWRAIAAVILGMGRLITGGAGPWRQLLTGLGEALVAVAPNFVRNLGNYLKLFSFMSFIAAADIEADQRLNQSNGILTRLRRAGYSSITAGIDLFAYVAAFVVSVAGKFNTDISNETYRFELESRKLWRPTQVPSSEALKMWIHKEITRDEMVAVLQYEGYTDAQIPYILENAKEWVSIGELLEYANRLGKDANWLNAELEKAGVRDVHKAIYAELRTKQLDIAALLDGTIRGHIRNDEYFTRGEQLGYNKAQLDTLLKSRGDPLAPGQLLDLLNRGEVDEAFVRQGIAESSINNKYTDALLKLRFNLLGASDYIRFAVREVFSPEQRKALQLDEDYPDILTEKLRKIGYSETDARDSWAAHWDLPSPTQVFTMLHYGLFDNVGKEEYVKKYLKAADYSPEWRDYLLAISYNPLTRVDARRAFKIGAINEAQLFETFKKEGYTPEDAQVLVDFTKADILGEKRSEQDLLYGPVKSTLLSMYKARRIGRDDLERHLLTMGFTTQQIEMFVTEVEFARQVDAAEDVAAALKGSYTKGLRSREDTKQLLINAGYDNAMAEQVLEPWDLLRQATEMSADQKNQRDLTQSQVITAIMDGIIPEEEGRAMIVKLGYDDNEATVLIETAKFRQAEQDRKDSIELIHQQFLNGQLQSQDAAIELDRVRTPATQKAALLLRWTRERNSRSTGFTFNQLKDFFLEGTMNEGLLYYYLRNLGYNDMDISFILVTWDAEKTRTRPALKKPISRLTRKDAEALYLATPPQKDQAIKILQDLGYTIDDIAYIREGLERALKAQKG